VAARYLRTGLKRKKNSLVFLGTKREGTEGGHSIRSLFEKLLILRGCRRSWLDEREVRVKRKAREISELRSQKTT